MELEVDIENYSAYILVGIKRKESNCFLECKQVNLPTWFERNILRLSYEQKIRKMIAQFEKRCEKLSQECELRAKIYEGIKHE